MIKIEFHYGINLKFCTVITVAYTLSLLTKLFHKEWHYESECNVT